MYRVTLSTICIHGLWAKPKHSLHPILEQVIAWKSQFLLFWFLPSNQSIDYQYCGAQQEGGTGKRLTKTKYVFSVRCRNAIHFYAPSWGEAILIFSIRFTTIERRPVNTFCSLHKNNIKALDDEWRQRRQRQRNSKKSDSNDRTRTTTMKFEWMAIWRSVSEPVRL